MDKLPIEIIRLIIPHLTLTSLKSFRQVCCLYAELGEESLIAQTFTSFPHRPDLARLKSVSEHTEFKWRVKEIVFNHGEINEYHARHNTYFLQFMREPEERLENQVSTWGAYTGLKALKEQHFPSSCDPEILTAIFSNLPNLEELKVSLMNCPFEDNKEHVDLLTEIWRIPSTRWLQRVVTVDRFRDILTAVAANLKTRQKLHTLSHDRLPFEFFAQRQNIISQFSPIFNTLTNLTIKIDYDQRPNDLHKIKGFDNLSRFLCSTKVLKKFELGFYGRNTNTKLDISPLLATIEEHGFLFEELEYLTLTTLSATENELASFLTAQPKLKFLRLGGPGFVAPHQPPNGGVHLEQGTFRGLFEKLRSKVGLEVVVEGDLVGSESGERWVLDRVTEMDGLEEERSRPRVMRSNTPN